MLAKIKDYALFGLLALSISLGGASVYLKNRNSHLSSELSKMTIAFEKAEENLVLVSDQLRQETKTRRIAEEALSSLKDVPDADYNQELPESVRSVLDTFHNSLR